MKGVETEAVIGFVLARGFADGNRPGLELIAAQIQVLDARWKGVDGTDFHDSVFRQIQLGQFGRQARKADRHDGELIHGQVESRQLRRGMMRVRFGGERWIAPRVGGVDDDASSLMLMLLRMLAMSFRRFQVVFVFVEPRIVGADFVPPDGGVSQGSHAHVVLL